MLEIMLPPDADLSGLNNDEIREALRLGLAEYRERLARNGVGFTAGRPAILIPLEPEVFGRLGDWAVEADTPVPELVSLILAAVIQAKQQQQQAHL